MIAALRQTPVIVDSNVPVIESGINVYDIATPYILGDVVQINATTNRLYKCALANTGIDPIVDVNITTGVGTYWVDFGATNYARAFDALNSSTCINNGSIYYKFDVDDVDLVYLSGLKATTVRIVTRNRVSGVVLWDNTYSISSRSVYDWKDWLTAPTEYNSSFFKVIPFGYGLTLEIYIDNGISDAEVGHIAYGQSKNYGVTLSDPVPTTTRRGIATKSRDEFGNIKTRKGARYKRMIINLIIDSISIDTIEDRFETIVDKPCIFAGDESEGRYKSLLIFGELKDHDMPIGISKTTYQLIVDGYV